MWHNLLNRGGLRVGCVLSPQRYSISWWSGLRTHWLDFVHRGWKKWKLLRLFAPRVSLFLWLLRNSRSWWIGRWSSWRDFFHRDWNKFAGWLVCGLRVCKFHNFLSHYRLLSVYHLNSSLGVIHRGSRPQIGLICGAPRILLILFFILYPKFLLNFHPRCLNFCLWG